MLFEKEIASHIVAAFPKLFNKEIASSQLTFQPTRKEFNGDITLVVFPLLKLSGLSADETGNIIGKSLLTEPGLIEEYNIIKGFLNINIPKSLWLHNLNSAISNKDFGFSAFASDSSIAPVLVEYSSPNTNKPLHLGHVRNILLGHSIGEILKANGKNVIKVSIVNDRGIHICKSMLAWKKFGNGETPQSSGLKGDHLVGKYYVEFDKHLKVQKSELIEKGHTVEEAEKSAPLMIEAKQMLLQWENGDKETHDLWKLMNGWVYEGFDVTYKRIGVEFDNTYYESQTYLLGKEIIDSGLSSGVLFKKPDGSVWIDLTAEGLDEKLLLRADGTSVYMTQDLGTALVRYNQYKFDKLIFVVGNEQEYHFKVLFLILRKLGYEWAQRLYHLAYNMVDLPSGKMKSREGTVVDADELINDLVADARKLTTELGKVENFESPESLALYENIGLGALKYFILKVDPDKRMLFNPDESIDFNGNTGPFIQYTHARLKSVLRKAQSMADMSTFYDLTTENYSNFIPREKELVKILLRFPDTVIEAGEKLSPAIIANYTYELAKMFNQFYHEHSIIDSADVTVSHFRLNLCDLTARIISKSMNLLGIMVPEKM